MERLAEAARHRWTARQDRASGPILSYIRREHDQGVVGPRWAALVNELSARTASRRLP